MLRHRGPDDRHAVVTRGAQRDIGLCVTRLAVRDPTPRGRQPMIGPEGMAIAFNGELYNAGTLRRELESRGRRFMSCSDTEVALAAFEAWGEAALPRMRGMFAIAVHDRACDRLVIGRDALGVKPLYYVDDARDGFAFASEVRALCSVLRPARKIDSRALEGYLALGAVPEPRTIIDGVRMLAPGTALIVTCDETREWRWWDLTEQFATTERLDRRQTVDRLRVVLGDAVRRQLVSDVPLGLFLSGGIDSSALVGLTAAAGVTPRTFSLVFSEPEFSEAQWIRAVAEHHATEHQEVELSVDDLRRELPSALAAMDQPSFDGVNMYVVSRIAREAGLTVALSGLGGDELFAGYELFRTAPRLERLRHRMPPLPGWAGMLAGRAIGGRGDRGQKLGRWLQGEYASAYELHREVLDPALRRELVGRHASAAPGGGDGDAGTINGLCALDLTNYTRNVLLRDADVMSMAHGLEVRVPFLDQEVVEHVARVPGDLKLEPGRQKGLLVDAVSDLLPPSIAQRPKMGFTLPFDTWLRGRLRDVVCEALMTDTFGGPIAELLNPAAVRHVWARYEAGRTGWSRPWAIYAAKVWGEANLAGLREPEPADAALSVTVRAAAS